MFLRLTLTRVGLDPDPQLEHHRSPTLEVGQTADAISCRNGRCAVVDFLLLIPGGGGGGLLDRVIQEYYFGYKNDYYHNDNCYFYDIYYDY